VSAGVGPISERALAREHGAIGDIEDTLLQLPRVSAARPNGHNGRNALLELVNLRISFNVIG
jgi:hypothetical protein